MFESFFLLDVEDVLSYDDDLSFPPLLNSNSFSQFHFRIFPFSTNRSLRCLENTPETGHPAPLRPRTAQPAQPATGSGETSLFALAHSISWCDQAPRHRRATVQSLVEGMDGWIADGKGTGERWMMVGVVMVCLVLVCLVLVVRSAW